MAYKLRIEGTGNHRSVISCELFYLRWKVEPQGMRVINYFRDVHHLFNYALPVAHFELFVSLNVISRWKARTNR